MHTNFALTESYSKNVRSALLVIVVVGSAAGPATKFAPHEIVRGVPLSMMRNSSCWKSSTPVMVMLDVMDVMLAAKAVMLTTSHVRTSKVGVALLVIAVMRGPTIETILPSTAITAAAEREMVVSVAAPSSMVPTVAEFDVPIVRLPPPVIVVPILSALAALMPPLVRIAPVVLVVVSSVDGKNEDAEAPVPPMVINVVAPAKAVNEVDGVVIEVVMSGLVNDWTPVNVCAASCLAVV